MQRSELNWEEFQDPPVMYRPMPFWGLNDDLKEERLREQIREMKDKGWGGFWTHSRYGLETPYLGEEYMEAMKICVDEAKKQGIKAWIYDEHPFPAGCAGGLATAPQKEYRHKVLVGRLHNRLTVIDEREAVAYFAIEMNDYGIPVSAERILKPENYQGKAHHFLHCYIWTEPLHQAHQPGFSNYDDNIIHGFASSDNLNPDAARKFIDVTYENFKSAVGEEFGKTLLGGFSDIPVSNWNYATPHPSVPWTTDFEKYFEKNSGYDLIPHLASLFFDVGEYEKVRCDYWKISNMRFVESFTKQLYEWCDKNNLIYTAHYWGEETLHWQIPWVGDAMSHFMYQHYVGMDHSIRNIEDPLGIKQASTVAEQLGKPRMISETYGMSGNSLSHEERKWIADWEYALGTNFLVPYIGLYSYRGKRKRDEPSSLFVQQAYWEHERPIYDYYGRLSYALTTGKRVVEILVMQPLSTAWTMYTPTNFYPQAHRPDPFIFEGSSAKLYDYNQKWMDLCDRLLELHRDFHVGNEAVMEEYACVEEDLLVVGQYRYKVVIIPESVTWSSSTIKLFQEFVKNGGTLIALEPLPTMIDGVEQESVLPKETIVLPDFGGVLKDALDRALWKDIVMKDCGDILYQHRKAQDKDIYFIANTSMENSYLNWDIELPGLGTVELWDAINGEKYCLESHEKNGNTEISLDFYPVTSYLLVKTPQKQPLPEYQKLPEKFSAEMPLGGVWKISGAEENALVLDYCEVQVENHLWSERLPVFQGFRCVKQSGVGTAYRVRYRFIVEDMPEKLSMLIENPEQTTAFVNGHICPGTDEGWWLDSSWRRFDISALIHEGENVIEFAGLLGVNTDIENCILLGNMAVDRENNFIIRKEIRTVAGEDLTWEGYPFFTGHLRMKKTFSAKKTRGKVYLSFDRVDTTLARVYINGKLSGELPWKPYILEITDYLLDGENEIEVELVTTRHNLLGPHHDRRGDVTKFCAPHIWTNEAMWTDSYYFSPTGVSGAKLLFA